MKKKPRIAVIGLKGLPAFGGAAAVGENIIEHLKDQYDFTVYATSSHTEKKGGMGGFQQIVFQALPFKKLNTLYYYILSALHAVFLGKYDLIHLHHRDAAFIMFLLKLRYKVVLTTHGSFYVPEKWERYRTFFELQEKYFAKFADIIINVSKNEQRKYDQLNITTRYIPNGINPTESFSISDRENSIFFGAGRIIKSKGCDIMLKALQKINYKQKILIAGDLSQTLSHTKEIKYLSQKLNVSFLGLIKNKDKLLHEISKARFFIFPSSAEAMSMMLLEAVSVKTPVIASDIIANKDIFDDDEVLYFETDNYLDLAEKVLWAENNYKIMLEKAERAYNKLYKHYNWDSIAKRYHLIYQELIESKSIHG